MLLSGRLVQLIQDHADRIADTLVRKVRGHSDLVTLAKRHPTELHNWCADQVSCLNESLLAPGDELKPRYTSLGRARFAESIPLHEAVLRLFLLKDTIIEFVHTQGLPMTALDLYAQEELEQRISRFFDVAVYHVVCGYEEAMRTPVSMRS
jgi:hypothetical protein